MQASFSQLTNSGTTSAVASHLVTKSYSSEILKKKYTKKQNRTQSIELRGIQVILLIVEGLKVRLHTAINRADFVSWCMLYTRTKVTKCIREKMTMCFRGESLNHIHQNTCVNVA